MRITPLDVRKQEFRRVVRGLDPDEVHAFLATAADEFEAALTDNKQLRERLLDLEEKVGEYRNMERTLRDTLLTAERVMNDARHNAKKEADLILRDAQLKAEQETGSIAQRVENLRAQLRELRGHRDAYLARLKGLSEAQIGLVESYQKDFAREDMALSRHVPPAPAQPELNVEPALLAELLQRVEDDSPRPTPQRTAESGHHLPTVASSATLIAESALGNAVATPLSEADESIELMVPAPPAAPNSGGWSMKRFTQGLGEV
jgi:cell division initiation protein